MKLLYQYTILLLVMFLGLQANNIYGQSNSCSTPTPITSSTTCSLTAGTTSGSSEDLAPATCSGFTSNSAKDVWYSFTAVSTSHTISVTQGTLRNAVIQAFSGTYVSNCTNYVSLGCVDVSSPTETLLLTGLTLGNTYTFRVYSYSTDGGASSRGTFTVCVTHVNDICNAAVPLTINAACNSGTTIGHT